MARVVALLTAPTHAHGHAPSKETEKPKRSVKMACGIETPLLRIMNDSISSGNKLVRFGRDFRSPITLSSRPVSGCGCVAKEARFEGFTGEALEVIMNARDESERLGHSSIELEHILLGLIGGGTGIAAESLKSMGIKLKDVREYAIKIGIGNLLGSTSVLWFDFSSTAMDLLILSFEEACKLGHNYIGPEHLLLGLLRRGSAREDAPSVLEILGFDLSNIRTEVLRMVGEGENVSVVPDGSTSITKVATFYGYGGANLMQGIGATTLDEYSEHMEKDMALAAPFLPNKVTEPSVEGTIAILMGLKKYYEIHHNLCYEDHAVITVAELSNQYISDGFLPDKAIDLFDKVGAHVSTRRAELLGVVKELSGEFRQIMKSNKEEGHSLDLEKFRELHNREMELRMQIHILHKMSQADKIVKEVDVQGIVSSRSGVPFEKLVIDGSDRRRKMEETLHKRVIGQDEAVKAVSFYAYNDLLRFFSSNPIASFLFYGPTGVGKSELAKALAATYFGSEEAVIQFDMTEFMGSHTLSKLIGSSSGHNEGGQLTDAVWRQPHTVVLFNEIEKAHLDVLNVIRQILSDGILADGKGRIVDFKSTLLIMTSNAGSSVIEMGEQLMEFDLDEGCRYNRIKSLVMEELKQWLGPNLIHISTPVIVFRHLNKLEVKEIADIKLKGVFNRLKAKEIQLHATERFRERVVEQGYDSSCGARPLKRAIRHLEDSIAEKMVARKIKEGDSLTVDVDSDGNAVILNG
ncbi:hypothetical protein V6N13_002454 [Hibiscus sabdariffa]|uniref:Clp R domain-containing protein n=1 Tax=Hibiscus sabdariffa TaxID=183260 RepID=A0ABR2C343_9ROSI